MISPSEPVNSVVFLTPTSFFDRGDVAPAALCFFFFLTLEFFFLCNRAIMHPKSQNSKLKMSGKSYGVSCHSSFELFIQNDLAGQEGFEPPTPGFGVRRSTVRATGLHNPFIIYSKESWPKGPGFGSPLKEAVLLKAVQVKSA